MIDELADLWAFAAHWTGLDYASALRTLLRPMSWDQAI